MNVIIICIILCMSILLYIKRRQIDNFTEKIKIENDIIEASPPIISYVQPIPSTGIKSTPLDIEKECKDNKIKMSNHFAINHNIYGVTNALYIEDADVVLNKDTGDCVYGVQFNDYNRITDKKQWYKKTISVPIDDVRRFSSNDTMNLQYIIPTDRLYEPQYLGTGNYILDETLANRCSVCENSHRILKIFLTKRPDVYGLKNVLSEIFVEKGRYDPDGSRCHYNIKYFDGDMQEWKSRLLSIDYKDIRKINAYVKQYYS